MKEFAENQTNSKFSGFGEILIETLKGAKENIRKTCKPLKEAQTHLDDIVKELEK